MPYIEFSDIITITIIIGFDIFLKKSEIRQILRQYAILRGECHSPLLGMAVMRKS